MGAADDGGAGANGGGMGATGGGVVTASVGNGSGESAGAARRRVACGGVAARSRGETRGGELGRGGTGRSFTIAGDGVAKSRKRMGLEDADKDKEESEQIAPEALVFVDRWCEQRR